MLQPSKHIFEPLSGKVLAACIDVQRQLGLYCMEIDYQRALEIALPKFGVEYQREVEIPIEYDGVVVTNRRVDFKCWDQNDELLLETKAASTIRSPDNETLKVSKTFRVLTKRPSAPRQRDPKISKTFRVLTTRRSDDATIRQIA